MVLDVDGDVSTQKDIELLGRFAHKVVDVSG